MKVETVCTDDARREAVRAEPELNGLDYVELGDDEATLIVFFLEKAPAELDKREGESAAEYKQRIKSYWQIGGGSRITEIRVVDAEVTHNQGLDDFATLRLDQPGDLSTYTLQLVGIRSIDPFYEQVEFSFKVDCPSPFDCDRPNPCPATFAAEPDINYLAKDYDTFRQLMLDRLALIMPDWQERHAPDLVIAVIEVLAYVADQLSYYQDAVATESYLDTARQRISVRRHARLVDYTLNEGCAARGWLHIGSDLDLRLNPRDVFFITSIREVTGIDRTILTAAELQEISSAAYEVFEAVRDDPIQVYAAHSEINFYTWGQRECCLPRGATAATLRDESERKLNFKVGDVLIFEEMRGPSTGFAADANPEHRHAVRLTKVTPGIDALNQQPVVEVEWSAEDALPFALCISSISAADAEAPCAYLDNVSMARGNVILVDHGLTIEPCEELGPVRALGSRTKCDCARRPAEVTYIPEPYRPHLGQLPLAFRQVLPEDDARKQVIISAARLLVQDPRKALPEISLASIMISPEDGRVIGWDEIETDSELAKALATESFTALCYESGLPLLKSLLDDLTEARAARDQLQKALEKDQKNQKIKDDRAKADELCQRLRADLVADITARRSHWAPQRDLLASGPDDRDFVVEVDNNGIAQLRFGDDECGEQPKAGATFYASYRVGGGTRGNVGAETITHLVTRRESISGASVRVRNPLPACGGVNPEPMLEAKLLAPRQFRQQLERAVIADDYARLAECETASVQRAAARLAWSGSWYEAEVAIDPIGGIHSEALLSETQNKLEQYRRIGHDLRSEWAESIPVELKLDVCVLPAYFRGHVQAELRDVFSNRVLPDGRRGFFHPDNLTFGEGIYLSQIVSLAQKVTGVESVRVTVLKRLFEPPSHELENGVLPLGPLEVAQLENNPSFPERGKLILELRGGR